MIIYYQKVTIHLVSHSPLQNSDHWPKNWTNPPVCWNWEMDGKGCIKLILLILFSQCKHFGSASYLLTFQTSELDATGAIQLRQLHGAHTYCWSFSIQSKFHQVQVSFNLLISLQLPKSDCWFGENIFPEMLFVWELHSHRVHEPIGGMKRSAWGWITGREPDFVIQMRTSWCENISFLLFVCFLHLFVCPDTIWRRQSFTFVCGGQTQTHSLLPQKLWHEFSAGWESSIWQRIFHFSLKGLFTKKFPPRLASPWVPGPWGKNSRPFF